MFGLHEFRKFPNLSMHHLLEHINQDTFNPFKLMDCCSPSEGDDSVVVDSLFVVSLIEKLISMTRKCHNHRSKTNPRHRKEEAQVSGGTLIFLHTEAWTQHLLFTLKNQEYEAPQKYLKFLQPQNISP